MSSGLQIQQRTTNKYCRRRESARRLFWLFTGVVASVGGIPNLVRRSPTLVPYLLAGIPFPQHLLEQHVFTEVVPKAKVLDTALDWARKITSASPDAVWVTKEQINYARDGLG